LFSETRCLPRRFGSNQTAPEMEDFPGFPEANQEPRTSFPAAEALIVQMIGMPAEDVAATVSSIAFIDARDLFFATFYRPFELPVNLDLTSETFDADRIVADVTAEESDVALDPIRTAVLRRSDVRTIDVLKWAVSEYPKALEWLRANGLMTDPKTRRLNTKLLVDLSPFVRTKAIEAFSSIIGYAIKDNEARAALTDIVVTGYAMGMPGAMASLLNKNGMRKAAARQIFISGPATSVFDLVLAEYPCMFNYVEDWNPAEVLKFMDVVNTLLGERKFNPEARERVAKIVHDVHIYAKIIKDEQVERVTKKWVSESDPDVRFFQGKFTDGPVHSGGGINRRRDDHPMKTFESAVVMGNLRKHPHQVSIEGSFEAMGLTGDVVLDISFDDPRMEAVAQCLLDLFPSDQKAIHPRALHFAIDFLNDYAAFHSAVRSIKAGPNRDGPAAITVGGRPWSRKNALDLYFSNSVYAPSPDFDETPMEHFRKIAHAGDDSTPGAAHLFDVLARHFGIVLVQDFIYKPSSKVASDLLLICASTQRSDHTPGGVVVRALRARLLAMYPKLKSEYAAPPDEEGSIHWLINPLSAAADTYYEQWKPNTDWMTEDDLRRFVH